MGLGSIVRQSSQDQEAAGREERRAEKEWHHDEEEPALIHGICSRRAISLEIGGRLKSNYGELGEPYRLGELVLE